MSVKVLVWYVDPNGVQDTIILSNITDPIGIKKCQVLFFIIYYGFVHIDIDLGYISKQPHFLKYKLDTFNTKRITKIQPLRGIQLNNSKWFQLFWLFVAVCIVETNNWENRGWRCFHYKVPKKVGGASKAPPRRPSTLQCDPQPT